MQAPPSADAVLDITGDETKWLCSHLDLRFPWNAFQDPSILCSNVLIENAPGYRSGARCQLSFCSDNVRLGQRSTELPCDVRVRDLSQTVYSTSS